MADTAVQNAEVVLFQEWATAGGSKIGVAQLNSEKSLNALSLAMIRLLDPQLQRWALDDEIVCVVIHGAGEKAFCAGGDVRGLYNAIKAHDGAPANPDLLAFFSEEYRLDYQLHSYSKPILVWGSGIVMGGGLGLLEGASHRVVTETSRIAMPEISIGLFPDVGGTWFLRRMPGRMGLFAALTGVSLNGGDAIAGGLADHFLLSADREAVFASLIAQDWRGGVDDGHAVLTRALADFASRASDSMPASNLSEHADTIETLTAGDDLAGIVGRIVSYSGDNPWLQRAAKTLAAGSPTTASLVWELRKRAEALTLAEVVRLELIVAMQCGAHPDFPEGVRALLIDKDNAPRWTPATLGDVAPAWIDQHFAAPWSGSHPLSDL